MVNDHKDDHRPKKEDQRHKKILERCDKPAEQSI